MLIAAACCPQPPLLVPELAVASDPELDALRDACEAALDTLFAARPDLVLLIGGGDLVAHGRPDVRSGRVGEAGEASESIAVGVTEVAPGARGSFADFGVDVPVGLAPHGRGAAPAVGPDDYLPLSLLAAGWLLRARPVPPARRAVVVDLRAAPAACRAAGRRLADAADRVALLVMGDGATHDGLGRAADRPQRAEDFDARVAAALAAADHAALAALDPAEAEELAAVGRAPWQVLAGAAEAAGTTGWQTASHYVGRPCGVGYVVASWVDDRR